MSHLLTHLYGDLSQKKLSQNKESLQDSLNVSLQTLHTYNNIMKEYHSKGHPSQLIKQIKSTMNTPSIALDKVQKTRDMIINSNKKDEDQYFYYGFNSRHAKNKVWPSVYLLLYYSFLSMNTIISKPIIEITPKKVTIHLFYYLFKKVDNSQTKDQFMKLNHIKLNVVSKILSTLFNKSVELELVRLYYPYMDSHIFVQVLNVLINKVQLRTIMHTLFKKAMMKTPLNILSMFNHIPSFLSGIHLKIGGRLMTQRIVPKKTLKTIRNGALSRGKIHYLDKARFTNKNKRGAFSLSVAIGHSLHHH